MRWNLYVFRNGEWQLVDLPQWTIDFVRATGSLVLSIPADVLSPQRMDPDGEPVERPNVGILPPWRLCDEQDDVIFQMGSDELEEPQHTEIKR